MEKNILRRPVISEKAEILSGEAGKYSFIVDKDANKLEVKKAVEKEYNVNVSSVNTMIAPGKSRVRYTKGKVQKGRKPSFKKAVVTLEAGETIDFFGEI